MAMNKLESPPKVPEEPWQRKGPIDGRFRLIDHDGREVSDLDFRRRFMLVFFGFSHCQVVCPRALGRISRALEGLGLRSDEIQPIYISVDPARDSPAVMKALLQPKYPRFIGLTGTAEQIEAAKRAYRVFADRKADPGDAAGYSVPHTAISYLLGPDGRYRAHFADTVDEQELGRRLAAILDSEAAR